MSHPFIPGEDAWVRSHYYDVPNETVEFCQDLAGTTILNVGCGEMLSDFGLLNCNVRHITGLDLDEKPSDHLEAAAKKLRGYQINPPADYRKRLTYKRYDGARFPFEDRQFDFVFSWSAFEHVKNVYEVLLEIHRVLSDDGSVFIQVYPWYHCFAGSHLTDYIREPYFHLKRDADWVRQEVSKCASEQPAKSEFLKYMLSEYTKLNHYSANDFYKDVTKVGFKVIKAKLISYDLDLSDAPEGPDFSSLMICGTKMLLKKKTVLSPERLDELTRIATDRERQIEEIHRSLSWRLTGPLRAAGSLVSRALRRPLR
jgi:SAM-dependent methyltransferase